MTWLIAGFGDLGREIAQTLHSDPTLANETVLALKRNIPAPPTMPSPNVRWMKADLSALDDLYQLPSGITHVVFCATPDQRDEVNYRTTYVKGLQNLVHALAHTGNTRARVLFVSSTAVYGAQQSGWLNEDSVTEPTGFNGRVLLEAENWLSENWSDHLILRLSGIYGPNRLLLLNKLMAGTATVPSSDQYWANRIHVSDAARAVIHLLGHQSCSGVYIGTDSTPVPLRTLYLDLARALKANPPPEGPASSMMGKKRLSNQKLRDSGFAFQWPDCREGYASIVAQQGLRH